MLLHAFAPTIGEGGSQHVEATSARELHRKA